MEHFHCNTEAHSSQRNCTIAVVDILQINDILYDFLVNTFCDFSLYGCRNFNARQILKILLCLRNFFFLSMENLV